MTSTIPSRMAAVQLVGHGGLDKLHYRTDVPVPAPGPGEVLIEVAAAGVNNTDINTRIGWYSKSVGDATDAGGAGGFDEVDAADAGWSGAALAFPRIQGADCCGRIVGTGEGVDRNRIGERVIVRSMMRSPVGHRPFECWTFGSECDGAFAQYAAAPAAEAYRVDCDWTDAELASIPCAYSTAENLLHRASVGAERVLVTGASGGVGSAAVQLAKRRGAHVVAVAGGAKADTLRAIGADEVVDRRADLAAAVGRDSVDAAIDLVAGPSWPGLLDILRRGGRYATAGAIAGPLVALDVRTLYLKDLTLLGCTFQEDAVFENLVAYIEHGEIRPLVAKTFPLRDIRRAQEEFLAKTFVGKLVLIPPG
ncbi:MAG: alcohol dehydrogenase family protein [Rhodospirillaceae bacterium]|nr:alcohol dehydrogenase family protein [Rhodospirillaceae bacterium]